MTDSHTMSLTDAAATEALGGALAAALGSGRVDLCGDLGAGKTTLARGLLRARGVVGAVRSPTYTLVEPYETAAGPVFHLDLYRLSDAEELHFLGLDEVFAPGALALIEWPQRAAGQLPTPDLTVSLHDAAPGRLAVLAAHSLAGGAALRGISSGDF